MPPPLQNFKNPLPPKTLYEFLFKKSGPLFARVVGSGQKNLDRILYLILVYVIKNLATEVRKLVGAYHEILAT